MSDDKTFEVKSGNWTRGQLLRAIAFLDSISFVLKSPVAEDLAAGLRVVVVGKCPLIESCNECKDIEARYPVLCAACAGKLGSMTPQRLIFKLTEDDKTVWAACSFSTVFIPKVFGRDNTINVCEDLLDDLETEEAVTGMMELLSSPQRKEGEYEQ